MLAVFTVMNEEKNSSYYKIIRDSGSDMPLLLVSCRRLHVTNGEGNQGE